jgi:hypothetical protein
MRLEGSVRAAFAMQARACGRLGSPFMARLMGLFAERLEGGGAVADALLGWPGDPGVAADNAPLRLAGGLHALVLAGAAPDLAGLYPPQEADDDALWDGVCRAMANHAAHLSAWLAQPPQTNEVRRAAALLPAFAMVARATGRPLALWEVGCAGGLNLRSDRFALDAGGVRHGPPDGSVRLQPDWDGPCPPPVPLAVVERRGVDIAPLDPTIAADRLRLCAYLWPDQPGRRALTEAAIAEARARPADIARADAVDWLRATLPERRAGAATVLFHTVAWQYLPPARRAEGDAAIAAAGARAGLDAPLARVAMEADGRRRAALTLDLWPEGTRHHLARVDFHGRSVAWQGPVAI